MNDIRKILNIILEIELNPLKQKLDRLYSIYSDEIYKIYKEHQENTDDYSNDWWSVYSYYQYNELRNDISELYDIVMNEITDNSQLYEVLNILHDYFCK